MIVTEQRLNQIVREVIREMDEPFFGFLHGANYNARMSKKQNNDVNAKIKEDNSHTARLPIGTRIIKDQCDNLEFTFEEVDNGNREGYSVVFTFDELLYLNDKKLVMGGTAIICDGTPSKIAIGYCFETQQFYRATYSNKGNIKRTYILDPDYTQTPKKNFDRLLEVVSNMQNEERKAEQIVNANGATQSIRHKPYSQASERLRNAIGIKRK